MDRMNGHSSHCGVKGTRHLLPRAIDEISASHPDRIWAEYPRSKSSYAEGFNAVTYAQFANAINGTAWWLRQTFGRPEDFQTLAYIGPNDIRYALLLIGAIKSGFKMFFTSPRNSIEAHTSLFKATKCSTMLTTDPQPPPVSALLAAYTMDTVIVPSIETLLNENHAHFPYEKTYEDSHNDPIYVMHTSGSTGIPKPLTYTHDWVSYSEEISQLQAPEGFETFNSSWHNARIVLLLPPFHIAGLYFSIINSIFNSSTIILPLALGIPTAESLAEALNYVNADAAFLAPATIEDISKNPILLEQISSKLELLFWSGGNLPQAAGDAVAARMRLYSCYGSSEYGAWPELREKGKWPKKDWNYFRLHPALSAKFRHRGGDLFELVLPRGHGHGNERLLTPFLHLPDLRAYPTNDLFSPHPEKPDFWHYRGRGDDIIVFLNGEKTNPITFEGQISSHPDVSAALMVGSQRMEAALIIELAAGVSQSSTEERTHILERIWPQIEEANLSCPAHARIDKTHVMFADIPFLRAGKGTVQRKPTLQLYASRIDKLYADAEKTVPHGDTLEKKADVGNPDTNMQVIVNLVKDIGNFTDVSSSTNLFELGVDSVHILQLSRKLKEAFACPISPATIYLNPTPKELEFAITQSAEKTAESASKEEKDRIERMEATFKRYASQIDAIASSTRVAKVQNGETNNHAETVVLTGSTGTTGSYLLNELLKLPSVRHIYCLNRSIESRMLQEKQNLAKGLPNVFPDRVTFITTNLSDSQTLGLDEALYQEMLHKSTLIIHSAWPINWESPLDFFSPQLSGIVNLVSFASSAALKPRVFFLSSISSVFNSKLSTSIEESTTYDFGGAATNGYGEAKLLAECLLDHAAQTLNIPVTIARICQLSGGVQKPAQWKKSEWFPSLVISSKYLRALPESLDSASKGDSPTIDWIPIDALPSILLELAFYQSTPGLIGDVSTAANPQIFHVSNHRPTCWSTLLPAVASTIARCLPASDSVTTAHSTNEAMNPRQTDGGTNIAQANGAMQHMNGAAESQQTNGDNIDPRTNATSELQQTNDNLGNLEPASGISTVPFSTWLDRLRASGSVNVTTNSSGEEADEDLFSVNPGLKMLGFFSEKASRTTPEPMLDTTRARSVSRSLASLEAIKPEWIARWVEGWMANGGDSMSEEGHLNGDGNMKEGEEVVGWGKETEFESRQRGCC